MYFAWVRTPPACCFLTKCWVVISTPEACVPRSTNSAEVVLQAYDVVFAEVVAELHFNKNQQLVSRIFYAVRRTDCDVDRFACFHFDVAIAERNLRRSLHLDPMLRALRVLLIAESFAGQHFNPFDFEVVAFVEHRECAPGPAIKFG